MLEEVEKFLQDESSAIESMEREVTISSWNANISGKDEDYEGASDTQKKMTEYFTSKERFETINRLLGQTQNALNRRQLEILMFSYLSSQTDPNLLNQKIDMSNKIEQTFNSFRAIVDGKPVTDNEINRILLESDNTDRVKEAWYASKAQGEAVSRQIIELAKVRNKIAVNLGFKNYCDFSLRTNEQSEEEITGIFQKLEQETRVPFKELKDKIDLRLSEKFGLDKKKLGPWHYGDLFFQAGPKMFTVNLDRVYGGTDILDLSKKFYRSIGLDVEDILARSDLYEKPGKNQHAFCTSINRNGDVRILENLVNNEYWASTTLHELGHGVYEKYISKNLPFLLRTNAHTFVTEAVAMALERFTKDPSFIEEHTGAKLSKEDRSNLAMQEKQRQLVFARWAMTVYGFEKELYANPDQDLNKIWAENVKKYQMIDVDADKPLWASKIHIPCYPMYYHNYLLGEMLASQIHAKAREQFPDGGLSNPAAGNFMTEKIFSKGASLRWDHLIKQSFGEDLNPKYLVKELTGKD